jgi:chromosome segregation ATPase
LDSEPGGNGLNSENTLERLIGISARLAELNERLRNELEDSRKNSQELRNMLEKSREEAGVLRAELEYLRTASTGLLNRADGSLTELAALREALLKAESSLTSLEQSFAAYRQAAELKIADLERSHKFYKIGFFAALIFALGGAAAAAVGFSR